MEKILLAGASGSVGTEVAKKLAHSSIPFRALVSGNEGADQLSPYTRDIWIADAQNVNELQGLCEGITHVFSSLGKSVSLFTKGHDDYEKTDYECNKNILQEAEKAGVKRMVYSSILGSNANNKLHLAQVHYKVQQLMQNSPLSSTIIKPTGFFSGLHDLVIMGKKGVIPVVGSGQRLTNPIHQEDLAEKVMDLLWEGPPVVEVGGPEVLSRQEIAQIVQRKTKARVVNLPDVFVRAGLPFFSFLAKDLSHNLDFFTYVTTRDMIAPSYGRRTFAHYIAELDIDQM